MTSRERVQRCVEFRRPDRVPRDAWLGPATVLEHGREAVRAFCERWPTDLAVAPVDSPAHRQARERSQLDPRVRIDEWGCAFVNMGDGLFGEVRAPRLADWSRLSDFHPPEEALAIDRDAIARFCAQTDRFVLSDTIRPYERMQFLRGSENLLLDIGEDCTEFHELLRRVHDYYRRAVEIWCRTPVDAIFLMDDWGTQQAMQVSPAWWRRVFKPVYADYITIARRHGKKVFMHSDGVIADIIEDLVEIGVDALNCQLFAMNIEELGRRFRGRLTFWGELDRQRLLVRGTTPEIRSAVGRVIQNLYSTDGGAIAQMEVKAGGQLSLADVAFRAWDEFTAAPDLAEQSV